MNDLLDRLKKAASISAEASQVDSGLFVSGTNVIRCSLCGGDEFRKGVVDITWKAETGKTKEKRSIYALECERCSRIELFRDSPRLVKKA